MPMQAGFFLLTGLAAIGFPGTIGFVAIELLIEGAVEVSALAGVAVVMTAALGSLAVLLAYFRIFTGTRPQATINLRIRFPERVAVLVLALLILGGGLFPQAGITSSHRAAKKLLTDRAPVNAIRSGLAGATSGHRAPLFDSKQLLPRAGTPWRD
jgi:NADH-quinone oxidoreductase subunit M